MGRQRGRQPVHGAHRPDHDVLDPTLERHVDRAKLRPMISGLPDEATLPDEDDPRLWYVLYDAAGDRRPGPDAAGGRARHGRSGDALRRLADPPPGPPITIPRVRADPADAPPDQARVRDAGGDFLGDLQSACRRLAGSPTADGRPGRRARAPDRRDARPAHPPARRLAREPRRRAARPEARGEGSPKPGIQVGGYGWVVSLAPDPTGEPDTQGFIHAPSLAHAATAAVLRSAWSAFSTDAGAAAFAVDLSSDRVRRADWILAGVRNGQTLEELLGGRFERRLHDALLDTYIDVSARRC